METSFNEIDKSKLKGLFKDYPAGKVIVDLGRNMAFLQVANRNVGTIEKRPDEWSIQLTAPLTIRFRSFVRGNKTFYYCTLKSIYDVVTVPLKDNTMQFINFLDKTIRIETGQVFTFTNPKTNILFGVIPELDFNIPRSLWNKAVAFERCVGYHVNFV